MTKNLSNPFNLLGQHIQDIIDSHGKMSFNESELVKLPEMLNAVHQVLNLIESLKENDILQKLSEIQTNDLWFDPTVGAFDLLEITSGKNKIEEADKTIDQTLVLLGQLIQSNLLSTD